MRKAILLFVVLMAVAATAQTKYLVEYTGKAPCPYSPFVNAGMVSGSSTGTATIYQPPMCDQTKIRKFDVLDDAVQFVADNDYRDATIYKLAGMVELTVITEEMQVPQPPVTTIERSYRVNGKVFKRTPPANSGWLWNGGGATVNATAPLTITTDTTK